MTFREEVFRTVESWNGFLETTNNFKVVHRLCKFFMTFVSSPFSMNFYPFCKFFVLEFLNVGNLWVSHKWKPFLLEVQVIVNFSWINVLHVGPDVDVVEN